jgi:hypothetical protein
MKKNVRRLPIVEFEQLTTTALLEEHERVFGPLTRQAKERMTRTASAAGFDRSWSWDRMDGLAA